MTTSAPIRVSPSVYSRAFGAELVLLEFARGNYFALDEIGSEIWRALEKGEAPETIASALVTTYDVAADVALTDVLSLIDEMRREGLLV